MHEAIFLRLENRHSLPVSSIATHLPIPTAWPIMMGVCFVMSSMQVVETAYSVVQAICDSFCPGDRAQLLDAIAKIHKTYRKRYERRITEDTSIASSLLALGTKVWKFCWTWLFVVYDRYLILLEYCIFTTKGWC